MPRRGELLPAVLLIFNWADHFNNFNICGMERMEIYRARQVGIEHQLSRSKRPGTWF
jgi:hypothetical protein